MGREIEVELGTRQVGFWLSECNLIKILLDMMILT